MKPITTSTFTFSSLIEGGYVYVDKTAILRELLRAANLGKWLIAEKTCNFAETCS